MASWTGHATGALRWFVVWLLMLGTGSVLADFEYRDFESTVDLNLVRDGRRHEDLLRLTGSSKMETGAAWYSRRQYVENGFATTFRFRISDPIQTGGEGFAFVVQNFHSKWVGGSRSGLGYEGLPNSLAVEFDTLGNAWESSPNHVSVNTRGTEPNTTRHRYASLGSESLPDLSDGQIHTVRVEYDPPTLSVYFDDLAVPVLNVDVDLASTLRLHRGAYVGFTAAAGDPRSQTHDILSWSFESPFGTSARTNLPTPEQREQDRDVPPYDGDDARSSTDDSPSVLEGQDDFDAIHYLLDLDFDPATRLISGTATVTALSNVAALSTVSLDLRNQMTVSAVRRDGIPLAFYHLAGLHITLDRPFSQGEQFQIEIDYSGVPGGAAFHWNKYVLGESGLMAWSQCVPEGAKYWWPCKDRPDDKALVEERWTVPSNWYATGNGRLIDQSPTPGGKTRFTWVTSHPAPTYLISIAATDYVRFVDTYTALDESEMLVENFVYAEDLADAQETLSETVPMISFFAETFGEYPFVEDKYGVSAWPSLTAAVEHFTNTSMLYARLDGTHDNDYLVAHELAHSWWGASLTFQEWAENWLSEGFARYSEALWFEHVDGADAYRNHMIDHWAESWPGTLYDPNSLFGDIVYDKGAWVVHMLRGMLGDDVFFGALRDWYAQNRDGNVTTPMLRQTMESHYGSTLVWFFDQWVYGENSPRYEFGHSTADRSDGTFRTYLRVRQVQTDADVFTMPIPVTLVTTSGDEAHTIWNDGWEQDYEIDSNAAVLDVLFDEHDWALKASTGEFTLDDTDGDGAPDDHDCDDLDPDTFPGAGEINDGLDNHCPGDRGYGLIDEISGDIGFYNSASKTELSWPAQLLASSYEIARSTEPGFSTGCLTPNPVTSLPSWDDPEVPPGGDIFHYLVRALGPNIGSWGADSNGVEYTSVCP